MEEGYCWVPRSLAGWFHHKVQRRQVVPDKRIDKLGPGNMLDIQKASGCAGWLLAVALGLALDLVSGLALRRSLHPFWVPVLDNLEGVIALHRSHLW